MTETPDAPVAPQTPEPTPRPVPRPTPRPTPRAPLARPTPVAGTAAGSDSAPAITIPVPDEAAATAAASAFGRVSEDGSVYVIEASGERLVGQFPGVSSDEALKLYIRRFLDLQAKVVLFEARLGSAEMSVKEIDQTLARLGDEISEPSAVGDLAALRTKLTDLEGLAKKRRAQLEGERNAARGVAVAARTTLVETAEAIAGTDPAKIQWRPAGDQLRVLLDEWKEAQRSGPRIDRPIEEDLWKRFSHARTAFDRERRHYFAELEQANTEAKSAKEGLVAEAEALSSSTQWGSTASAYRDLMARWKSAGRANRKDDDALWNRFRAAQDAFFNARDADNVATDAEFGANLVVKEAILAEAEKLVPVSDLTRAKNLLRDLQDQWEAAGKVPRADVQRVEGRMRAIETAIRDAEDSAWKRTNPETQARAEGAAAQLETSIATSEAELAEAQAKGDKRKIKDLEAALVAKKSWLEQIVKAAQDARG